MASRFPRIAKVVEDQLVPLPTVVAKCRTRGRSTSRVRGCVTVYLPKALVAWKDPRSLELFINLIIAVTVVYAEFLNLQRAVSSRKVDKSALPLRTIEGVLEVFSDLIKYLAKSADIVAGAAFKVFNSQPLSHGFFSSVEVVEDEDDGESGGSGDAYYAAFPVYEEEDDFRA